MESKKSEPDNPYVLHKLLIIFLFAEIQQLLVVQKWYIM